MAIRFQCSSCSQPIEVDDEWATKMVACPYCRNTITAPAESTVTDPSEIPTATPIVGMEAGPAGPVPLPQRALGPSKNVVALVALLLSLGVLALLAAQSVLMSGHSLEWNQMEEEIRKRESESVSRMQAFNEYLYDRGGALPSWLVASTAITMCAMAGCVGAIVCGILGLRRVQRRPLAIAALLICGSVVVFFCAGIGISLSLFAWV